MMIDVRRCRHRSFVFEAVEYLENGLTLNRQILHEPSYRQGLHHVGYDVTNYFLSEFILKKTVENPTSDGFRWNFLRKL